MQNLKWYDIYDYIVEGLYKFYEINGTESGYKLFNKCKNEYGSDKFLTFNYELENPWIEKFDKKWNRNSLDPFHIFASFNYYNISKSKRISLLNFYFNVLEIDYYIDSFESIDFTGIPSPRIDKIVAARTKNTQDEIWEFFIKFFLAKKQNNSYDFMRTSNIFKLVDKWYGIAVPSLTIFLFWIDSDNFLPLDNNTRNFLEFENINIPNDSYTYIELLSYLKNSSNFSFRELVAQVFEEKVIYSKPQIIRKDDTRFIRKKTDIPKIEKNLNHINIPTKDEKVYEIDKYKSRLQILAIKPIKKSDNKFLKTLNETLYSFNDIYQIDKNKIIQKKEIYKFYDIEELKLNVNAIVGENGAGKSTIIELLIIAINNIAKKLQNDLQIEYIKDIFLDLYVYIDKPYKFAIRNEKLEIYEYNKKLESRTYILNTIKLSSFKLDNLFYNILLNYSLYGLNSEYNGEWLHNLFHKNDSYQTPIVIEPFRKKGNIDVNQQMKLLKSRLLSNILEKCNNEDEIKKYRMLTKFQIAKELKISINFNKVDKIIDEEIIDKKYKYDYSNFDKEYIEYVIKIIFRFSGIKLTEVIDIQQRYKSLENISKLYLFKKLIVILLRYKTYKKYFDDTNNKIIFKPKDTKSLFKKLYKDNSHIAYKLKQIINFIKYVSTYREIHEFDESHLLQKSNFVIISLDKLSDKIYMMMTEIGNENINEFIIPTIFDTEIIMDSNSSFEILSSGEQQLIYVVNSLIYQLKNINSVNSDDLISYSRVNIILEEIELYFHPEMQRAFLNKLRETIKLSLEKANLDNINSISLFFITHSPFILSEIPSSNLMLLKRDSDKKTIQINDSNLKTFGANIHELLSENFFLDNTIGEYAYIIIKNIIMFLNNEDSQFKWENKHELYNIIIEIGEPFLRNKLLEIFNRKFDLPNKKEIESIELEIKKLEEKKEFLMKPRD